jgi:quercetin dioxygenase-like cupin family protein
LEATVMTADRTGTGHVASAGEIIQVKMKIGTILVAAASAFGTIAMSHGAASATVGRLSQNGSAVSLLPADHRIGPGAIITRVCVDRATNLKDSRLSIFLVDYPPGASVMLHRMPSSGYVLVYVLSGSIRASAWHAGLGSYRAGETWVEPAFAYSISAKNPSANESARTLVVVVTGSQEPDNTNDMTPAE